MRTNAHTCDRVVQRMEYPLHSGDICVTILEYILQAALHNTCLRESILTSLSGRLGGHML
jgi:hypothetical protein